MIIRNSVAYEGANNATITCEGIDTYADWTLHPFAYNEDAYVHYLTTNGELNPAFNELFAIDHQQGTDVYTLFVFNLTISPPEGSLFSTAGLLKCSNSGTQSYGIMYLVVIRKFEFF